MSSLRGLTFSSLVLTASLISACSADLVIPQPNLPVASACFITNEHAVPISVELAKSYKQRQKGLMGRTTLAVDTGMLFIYQQDQDPDRGFWMYQTLLPLDIAYLDDRGVIGSIKQMAPCSSVHRENCPEYPAGVVFTQAIEMNKGFFHDNKIGVGDQLIVESSNCQTN